MDPKISFAASFAEYEACRGAGLDLWKWEQGDYPVKFKARVMAWWKLHKLVRLHSEDAVAKATRRKTKRGGGIRRRRPR